VLQAMRSSAKYIWIFLVIFFVGGFLLAETSGLLGRAPVTSTTAVATVNGEEILATTWYNAINALEQQATQQTGRSITLDERQRLADEAYEQLVGDALLRQEYRRRLSLLRFDKVAACDTSNEIGLVNKHSRIATRRMKHDCAPSSQNGAPRLPQMPAMPHPRISPPNARRC